MKLVAGLGNPGSKYQFTRHNMGFMVVDGYVQNSGLTWQLSQDWEALFAKDSEVIYLKPQTFMNRSGFSLAAVANFYKIKGADILVIYDELDLPFGKLRLSYDGLTAGHKGLDSVVKNLGGADFGRLRVGIGRPEGKNDPKDFVLTNFSDSQKKDLDKVVEQAQSAISSYLADGIEATMNKFN